ncbi:hypothetical protein Ciccas_013545 [Cichlidogyrus casuarinus]|uniref:Uncharacterized protein n=1 Tax=Cichlidogyrus casuarinus TaxID=1844966 RepID=A0ABD2PLE9_9PLAT
MSEEEKLAEACDENDQVKVLKCLNGAYINDDLEGLVKSAYGKDPDLFLRLLKKFDSNLQCMGYILMSIKGLRNRNRDGFKEGHFENYYKLEDIVPFYEAFVQRGSNKMSSHHMDYALKGYYALVMGLKNQLTASLLQKVLILFVNGCNLYAECEDRANYTRLFRLNFLKLLCRLPTRKAFFVVKKTKDLKDFWIDAMFRNYSMCILQFFNKIYVQNDLLERNLVKSLTPFMGGRINRPDDVSYYDRHIGSVFGVPEREYDYFEANRFPNESTDINFLFGLYRESNDRVQLTNLLLTLLLEIAANIYNVNRDVRQIKGGVWNWMIRDLRMQSRMAALVTNFNPDQFCCLCDASSDISKGFFLISE